MWIVMWKSPYDETEWKEQKFQGKNAENDAYVFWRKKVENYHRSVEVFIMEKVNGKIRNKRSDGGKVR
jgi:hypothetical protein